MTGRSFNTQDNASRNTWLTNTANWINNKLPASLSYYTCIIDGEERNCGIVSSNNTDQKKIISMPGERLLCGSYVQWMDNTWLITQLEASYQLYQTAIMRQCNYLLRWVNDEGAVISRWVYAQDGTKYMTGEYYQGMLTVGDARYQVTMPRDEQTAKINRGDRFIIDDPMTPNPMAFEVTKPNRVSNTYVDEHGVYITMMVESNLRQDDNTDLMIANYYSRIGKVSLNIVNLVDGMTIRVGDEVNIESSLSVGGEPRVGYELEYKSSDDAIAAVDKDGLLIGVGEGECTITVAYGAQQDSILLNVESQSKEQPSKCISIETNDGSYDIYVGTSKTIDLFTYIGANRETKARYQCSIDSPASVASVTCDGSTAIISTASNRKNIGQPVMLTVTDVANNVEDTKQFKIRGWA